MKQSWQPIDQISPNLLRGVLAGEDARFFQHNGFDTVEIQKSFGKDWEEGAFVRGASTITQQLAKNLYLSESKNPLRKVKEAAITYYLEKNLGKKRILEVYLNVIEWGDGVFGAEAAAQKYFGKSISQVSVSEAAYLTAMIPILGQFITHQRTQNE
ncbi:MAG: monofunctional biosynthetic peptidoglycan transglycosylase [Blastocatellia bacterium]|nr:monofunctional biosynthetic peptidoglycan transglycosylase [Blastocatellia bacterium]